MRRPIASIWDVPSTGVLPALTVTAAFFLMGGLTGCIIAAFVGGDSSSVLTTYLRGFLTATSTGSVSVPALAPLLWEVVRWPLVAILLGFTALGLVALPILFTVRGFLLAFSIASFVRMFGSNGLLLAFLVFGLSGFIAVPILFVLGVQSLLASRELAGRVIGDGKRNFPYNKIYFMRCVMCVAALCICIFVEYFAVPALVAGVAGALVP